MACKRVSRGAASRGPKNNVWTTVLADAFGIATGATQQFNVVQDNDWTTVGGQERATVLRIRGWLALHNKITTGVLPEGSWFAYLTVQDEDAPAAVADVALTYAEEDILWTDGGVFTVTDTNATGHVSYRRIDVKAMRKIRTGQELRLVVTNSVANTIDFSAVVRALLRRGGN